jgi:hypothetical protein
LPFAELANRGLSRIEKVLPRDPVKELHESLARLSFARITDTVTST